MANLKLFISSTYEDLKHFRDSINTFFIQFGYDIIQFENGDIPYLPNTTLFNSCLKEIENSEIFVLIIGKRYGTAVTKPLKKIDFCTKYESITRAEFNCAKKSKTPLIWALIDKNIISEYKVYKRTKNKDCKKLTDSFSVDSINSFDFLQELYDSNIPIQEFEIFSNVKEWLIKQLSGNFKSLLRRSKSIDESIEIIKLTKEFLKTKDELKLNELIIRIGTDILSKEIQLKIEYMITLLNNANKNTNIIVDYYIHELEELRKEKGSKYKTLRENYINDNFESHLDFLANFHEKTTKLVVDTKLAP